MTKQEYEQYREVIERRYDKTARTIKTWWILNIIVATVNLFINNQTINFIIIMFSFIVLIASYGNFKIWKISMNRLVKEYIGG